MSYRANKRAEFRYKSIAAKDFAGALEAALEMAGYTEEYGGRGEPRASVKDKTADGIERDAEVPLWEMGDLDIGEASELDIVRSQPVEQEEGAMIPARGPYASVRIRIQRAYWNNQEPTYLDFSISAPDAGDIRTILGSIVERFELEEVDSQAEMQERVRQEVLQEAAGRDKARVEAVKSGGKGCLVTVAAIGTGLIGFLAIALTA